MEKTRSEFSEWYKQQFPSFDNPLMPEEASRLRNEVVAGEQARELLVYDRMVAAMLDAARKAWDAGYDAGRNSVK